MSVNENLELAITIDNPMLQALRAGVREYLPVIGDTLLAREWGDADTSLANAKKLIENKQRRVCALVGAPNGVLIVFSSGETYLATGFAVGKTIREDGTESVALPTLLLARFAAEAGLGDEYDWREYLGKLPEDWDDEIRLPNWEPSPRPPKIY